MVDGFGSFFFCTGAAFPTPLGMEIPEGLPDTAGRGIREQPRAAAPEVPEMLLWLQQGFAPRTDCASPVLL